MAAVFRAVGRPGANSPAAELRAVSFLAAPGAVKVRKNAPRIVMKKSIKKSVKTLARRAAAVVQRVKDKGENFPGGLAADSKEVFRAAPADAKARKSARRTA